MLLYSKAACLFPFLAILWQKRNTFCKNWNVEYNQTTYDIFSIHQEMVLNKNINKLDMCNGRFKTWFHTKKKQLFNGKKSVHFFSIIRVKSRVINITQHELKMYACVWQTDEKTLFGIGFDLMNLEYVLILLYDLYQPIYRVFLICAVWVFWALKIDFTKNE